MQAENKVSFKVVLIPLFAVIAFVAVAVALGSLSDNDKCNPGPGVKIAAGLRGLDARVFTPAGCPRSRYNT